jgi:hypothetical protein
MFAVVLTVYLKFSAAAERAGDDYNIFHNLLSRNLNSLSLHFLDIT